MHFGRKSYLKSNRNHTVKQTLKCWDKRKKGRKRVQKIETNKAQSHSKYLLKYTFILKKY